MPQDREVGEETKEPQTKRSREVMLCACSVFEGLAPTISCVQESGSISSDGENTSVKAVEEPAGTAETEEGQEDLLLDLPPEALRATTRNQFVHHMRPYVWVKYPSAMATEVNAFINARWNLLKANRKAGECNNGADGTVPP